MHRRLAAGELHGHLPARLDLHGVVQNFLNLLPAQLVNVADLVRVHEAGIAHHVAAIGQVHRKHGAAAVANGARTVLVQTFVVVRRNIAAGEILLDPLQELRVHGHQVFVLAVDGAFLHHPDLTVALDDLRLDFADLLVHQVGPVLLAVHDRIARLFHAIRAQRIGRARPAERGLRLLPRLQQRLIGPFRSEGRIRIVLIEELNGVIGDARRLAQRPVKRFPNFCACRTRHKCTFPFRASRQIKLMNPPRALAPASE